MSEHILFDHDGQKLPAHFDKNGFFDLLDRTNMQPVRVTPFVDRTDWGRVDPASGACDRVARADCPAAWYICPGPAGAKEWNHGAFSPRTQLLYVPVVD